MCLNKKYISNSKCSDYNYYKKVISFKNGKCYHDGIYYGDIIAIDEKVIKVFCKKRNRYMYGQIIEYVYVAYVSN